MEKTYFIAFEGIDGCGKDTQLHKLIEKIKDDSDSFFGNKYSNIWVTREPTKITPSGRKISQLIRERDVGPQEASELFIQDRKEHTKLIKEMLKTSHVITSRYDLSTLSFQMSKGQSFDELYEKHNYDLEEGSIIPDITLVFDLEVKEAFKRMSGRDSVQECFENEEFQKQVKENLKYCIEELRKRDERIILVINANQSIEQVTQEMIDKINGVISKNGK